MRNIAIYGAGGFGREVKMLIDQINNFKKTYNFLGYFDDGLTKSTIINRFQVIGGINELNNYPDEIDLVISIADPKVKRHIFNAITNPKVSFPKLIHPNSIIGDENVSIGEGSIICAGAIITIDVKIGYHVILNIGCTVGHDTTIGSFSSFMPSVNISGEVNIEEEVYCGTGAKIINQLSIGQGTIVGAGSLVSKSLPAFCTAVGFPAKVVKFNNN